MKPYNSGFTLIELMIVVAIVAILAAVAVPSYQQYVQKARRAECQAFALDIASRQERHYTQYGQYAGQLVTAQSAGNEALELIMPNGALSENQVCRAGIVSDARTPGVPDYNTYDIRVAANPIDVTCGLLTLDNQNRRSAFRNGGQDGEGNRINLVDDDVRDQCWR
ncbi:MAG: type IV pilus assembly protein PilE [Cellvibrionaceae bacterium]|jgi:type IV pilus assembly protein PilE